ncbi:hypothetical protein [Anaerocolumna xylanovorans]|uniref:Uncharacterized protein n=1 Tax=Anaerocolumna xylanovorans DSM 12503 TaxID=1121345 RepID=A0A1M7Y434_9FIRM|nr:hypothetical protein [Anaerocolumna xylanovorans]SHO47014.1 hypothetical protein SAMN02745217_01366 [Anaerocolumna xylanovorans DSM 12503]
MKLTDLALIFLVIEILLFSVLDIRFDQLKAVTEKCNAYNRGLDNAVDDGCYFLVEKDSSHNLRINKEKAVEQFFTSLYANFGVIGQPAAEENLNRYIPVILVTDKDGFYIQYSEVIDRGGEKLLVKRWSEKIPYVYEDERIICCFTLDDYVRVFDKASNTTVEGDYRDVKDTVSCSFLQEEGAFDEVRRNTVINEMEKNMEIYMNYYNEIAGQFGITYQFWLPGIDKTDWDRTIDDISLFVVFQGYPYNASSLDTYNRYAFGGARIRKSRTYCITESGGKKYYHKENCTELAGNLSEPYYSKEECAKEGAFPCLKCIP